MVISSSSVRWGGTMTARAYETWDNQPGGTVIERYTDPNTGMEYVLVEFEKTPGRYFVYYAD